MDNREFESKVSTELFAISGDLGIIKRALLALTKDIQLNMTYCDVITEILEESGLSSPGEIKEITLELNKEREAKAKKLMKAVTEKLDTIVDEQNELEELLRNAPVKGEA